MIRGLLRWLFTVFYGFRWYGRENMPLEGPVLLIANHQSHFDPPAFGVVVGDRPFAGLARSTLFSHPVCGWALRSIGTIPLVQGKGDTSAFRIALARLKEGRSVIIFPEGTRTCDGALHEFQRGVRVLLKRAQVPVIACAIEGAHDTWPIGTPKPRVRGRIQIMIGPPHEYEELLCDGADAALEKLKREIETMRMVLRRRIRTSTRGRWPSPGPGDVPYWQRQDEQ
jgi:1-acyl-sn-glycerol-3-phosphate acyltransferase